MTAELVPLAGERSGLVAVRLSFEDIASPPRERFVLGTMIPFAKVSVLYGPSHVGKSALAAQIVFAFAAGAEQLWGLALYRDEETDERGGPVLVYTAEDTLDDWKRKGAAIRTAGGVEVERALERVYVVDQSEGLARLSEVVTVRVGDSDRAVTRRVYQPTEEREQLVETARSIGARLILVETTSRLVDDEDNASFSALQSALGHVGRETGAAVLLSHHATKAATKGNDSSMESARGGGALVANARNALALFPAEPDEAKRFRDRFPADDVVKLEQTKGTSSTRRSPPLTLVRIGATWGAVFRLPDEVALTPEQTEANAARLEEERQREWAALRRLYAVVERALSARPAISPSWLRDNSAKELGLGKHHVEPLVRLALDRGVLKVNRRTERGITVCLGVDPRKPVNGTGEPRADPGDQEALPL